MATNLHASSAIARGGRDKQGDHPGHWRGAPTGAVQLGWGIGWSRKQFIWGSTGTGEGWFPPLCVLLGKHGRVCAPWVCAQHEGRLLLRALPQTPNFVATALHASLSFPSSFISEIWLQRSKSRHEDNILLLISKFLLYSLKTLLGYAAKH